ncbi:unnamed protein product [Brassica oleracea]
MDFFMVLVSCVEMQKQQSLSIRCARVGGVEIPSNKRIEYSLQYIHGIGRTRARQILVDLQMENKITKDMAEEELIVLRDEVSKYMIEGDLIPNPTYTNSNRTPNHNGPRNPQPSRYHTLCFPSRIRSNHLPKKQRPQHSSYHTIEPIKRRRQEIVHSDSKRPSVLTRDGDFREDQEAQDGACSV